LNTAKQSVDEAAAQVVAEMMNVKWRWLVMEGEVEICENCKGPECECVKESQRES